MIQSHIDEILQSGILPATYSRWTHLQGGTNSQVVRLHGADAESDVVLKVNTPEQIAAEAAFYSLYADIAWFPRVVHVHPAHRYLLYQFVPGETGGSRPSKAEWLHALVQDVILRYRSDASNAFPWLEEPQMVDEDLAESARIIGSHLSPEDYELVRTLNQQRAGRLMGAPRVVLHGDFGVHNFVFGEGGLAGVIDPIPSTGRPLYDLLFAFCSSPDDLEPSVLFGTAERLQPKGIDSHQLVADLLITLYQRIGTCLFHHPHDLPLYLEAWARWVSLV